MQMVKFHVLTLHVCAQVSERCIVGLIFDIHSITDDGIYQSVGALTSLYMHICKLNSKHPPMNTFHSLRTCHSGAEFSSHIHYSTTGLSLAECFLRHF